MKKRNILQIILVFYLIINVLYLFVGGYLRCDLRISMQMYAEGYIKLLVINCLIIMYMIFRKKYKFKAVDIFLVLSIILGIIATVYAFAVNVSLYGFRKRNEGLFQICYYISLIITSSFLKEEKYKKSLIYTILFTGIIQFAYGFLQVTNTFKFINIAKRGVQLATGTITNSNFYGTYMLLCLSYSTGLFIDTEKKLVNIIHYILFIMFTSGILIANALSSILAFIILLFGIAIYLIYKRKYIKLIFIVVGFLVSLIVLTKFNLTFAISDLVRTKDEVIEISKGNFDNSFGTDRMYVWKSTMKIVPKYMWHGVGIDNFYYAFDGKPLTLYNAPIVYDKAHNEYLQTLITQGIFALLCWLTIYGLIAIEGTKNSLKNDKIYLILPVLGYLIQAFFNISVIEVAPLFYIGLGLNVNRENMLNYKKIRKKKFKILEYLKKQLVK